MDITEREPDDRDEEMEEKLTEEDLVSPHVRPWLEKRLGTPVSPLVWKIVNRYVLLDYDPHLDPAAWPKEEQATFVEEVQAIQGAQTKDLRRAYHQGEKRAAPQTGEPSTTEASTLETYDWDISGLLGSSMPHNQPAIVAAEARAASVLETGNLRALLRSDEVACATAIASYFGAFIMLSPAVQSFRRDVLGNRLLSPAQADDWIVSPLSRFLNREDMAPFVPHLVQSGALPDAQVISWEQGGINGRQAQERVKEPGVLFQRPPVFLVTSEWNKYPFRLYTIALRVKENRGGSSGENKHEEPMLLTRRLITHSEGLLWAPFVPIVSRDYGRAPQEEEDKEEDKETFPRVFPGSVADELGRIARGFAQVLPFEGEQIARFLLTGETMEYTPVKMTVRLPCRAVANHAVEGEMPAAVTALSSPSAATAHEEGKIIHRRQKRRRQRSQSKLVEVLVRRLQQPALAASLAMPPPLHSHIPAGSGSSELTGLMAPNCVRGYIRLEAEPWVSAETIEAYWRHFQEKSLREEVSAMAGDSNAGDSNAGSSGAGTTLRLRKSRVHRTHRVTSVQAAELVSFVMQANIAAVTASITAKGKSELPRLPSLYSLHQQLNRNGGAADRWEPRHLDALHGYSDLSVLIRVYRQACHALDLPDNLAELAKTLWKKQNGSR